MTLEDFLTEWRSSSPLMEVRTSGSTGKPKRMLVEKRRMRASARVTCDFLGLRRGDTALLCMPLEYIAGKMMAVRAEVCGLRLVSVEPSAHPLRGVDGRIDFAAMVPMQVYSSLRVPGEAERLRAIRHLIIGGGAIDDALEQELRAFPNAVWSTYGMTETLSHIALRRVSGDDASLWYEPFDGVSVSLSPDGCLVIHAPAVSPVRLVTNDIAELQPCHGGKCRFRIIGRRDNVICSGGIKIQAEEAERLLRPHMRCGFMITRVPDARLGEAVTLLADGMHGEDITAVCRAILPRHWVPRHILRVAALPLTPTGKPARADAEALARKMLS